MALLGVTGLSSTPRAPACAGAAFAVVALATAFVVPNFAAGAALAADSAGVVPIASNGGLRGSDEQMIVFNVINKPESCDC